MDIDAPHQVGHNLYDTLCGGIRTRSTLIQDFVEAKPKTREFHLAFAAVFARYAQAVYGYIRHRYRKLPIPDAEDVAAEVLAELSGPRGLGTYLPSKGKFRSWLRTLIRHRVNNLIKYHHRERRDRRITHGFDDLELGFQENLTGGTDPLEYLEVQIVLATINEAIANVRKSYAEGEERDRFDALRVYLPGITEDPPSYAEMAQQLQGNALAIKAEVCRLRRRVKDQLSVLVRESLHGATDEVVLQEIASMAELLARRDVHADETSFDWCVQTGWDRRGNRRVEAARGAMRYQGIKR